MSDCIYALERGLEMVDIFIIERYPQTDQGDWQRLYDVDI